MKHHLLNCRTVFGFERCRICVRVITEDFRLICVLATVAFHVLAELVERNQGNEIEGKKSPDPLKPIVLRAVARWAVEIALFWRRSNTARAEYDHRRTLP